MCFSARIEYSFLVLYEVSSSRTAHFTKSQTSDSHPVYFRYYIVKLPCLEERLHISRANRVWTRPDILGRRCFALSKWYAGDVVWVSVVGWQITESPRSCTWPSLGGRTHITERGACARVALGPVYAVSFIRLSFWLHFGVGWVDGNLQWDRLPSESFAAGGYCW